MTLNGFQENCPRGKLPLSPNSNASRKPNPAPDRGAIFFGGNFPDTLLTILTGKDLIQYRNGWLAASDLLYMFTQSIKFYTFYYQNRCLKNVIHQIDSKNEWLLLSASLRQNFWLVFVLTLEKASSQRFHFQANRKTIGSSKKWYQGFSKQPSV